MDEHKLIPIICGPTGSGKTSIALELAKNFPIEIISADSRQMLKHLNIGTAKPTKHELTQCTFHLVDIIEPGERYSAFNFIDDAEKIIDNILKRGKTPLIVGGTGLYLRALTDGVVEIKQEDFSIREKLEAELEEKGTEFMHRKLEAIDPLESAKIHPNNKFRIVRALEIFYLTGHTKSELLTTGKYRNSKYKFSYYCLSPKRELLYERINNRVDQMLSDGLLKELNDLIASGYKEKIEKANVIGYAELLKQLNNDISFEEAVAMIKQNSRRYAKRQMTWFRKQSDLTFYEDASELIEAFELSSELKYLTELVGMRISDIQNLSEMDKVRE